MGLFKVMLKKKKANTLDDFNNISINVLETLYFDEEKTDYEIAELFGVSESKVTYKRRKFGLTIRNKIMKDILSGKSKEGRLLNEKAYNDLLNLSTIDQLSKVITHFAFRNGPVENMHAQGKLTEDDMKTLNKFMVNRLAYLLQLVFEKRWLELALLVELNSCYGANWDKAEPDDGKLTEALELLLKTRRSKHFGN